MLLTAVEQRRIGVSALTEYDAAVTTAQNYSVIFENILRVLPKTRNITFITGNSPNERFWRDEMNREAKAFGGRVSFTSLSDLPFAEIVKQVSELAPHTVIFWRGVQLDGTGGVHEGDAALKRLHAVAKGPIVAVNDVFFTPEITGGLMISVAELSRVAAATGVRILEGEKPASIKVPPIGTTTSKYNWREMQRWGISESTLPPGSEVHFRELSLWQQYPAQMLAIIAALMAQAALIGWLFYEHRRRHIAEVLARNSMAELTHMNRVATVGEFSASIAHEVNQPLTGIVTRASAGRRWLGGAKPDIEKARAAFDQIEAAGHRASEIIKNLRSIFKRDHPQDKSLVDVNKLVWTVLELVRVDLQKHRIDVEPRFDHRIPPVLVNEVQLEQVVLNLITNAIDSMRSAKLRVLSISTVLTDPDRVQVSIEDTGTGIDPANLDQIFKPMFTTKDNGMGMGLSICHSIIENHDGRISVAAGSKSGTIFHFELPTKAA
jgi:signal transduction histidine kinase